MWLVTRYGFYSIACAQKPDGKIDPSKLMMRARSATHLDNLKARFPVLAGQEIRTTPDHDYRWRLIVTKATWSKIVAELVEEQEWSNFKNEAHRYQGDAGSDYVRALHDVWSVMNALQEIERRVGRKKSAADRQTYSDE
jgi:hypothetical protein